MLAGMPTFQHLILALEEVPETKIRYRIDHSALAALFDQLASEGYEQIGPVARDGAIMLDTLGSFDELARGFYDKQDRGSYQLIDSADGSFFHYTLGPQSFKQFLHPPRRQLWTATRNKRSFSVKEGPTPPPMVFWGVRNCDLAAIRILDRVFLEGATPNAWYQEAREKLFIVSVACSHPSQTCFCTSNGSGPSPQEAFDMNLMEVKDEGEHYLTLETGSAHAEALVRKLNLPQATAQEIQQAEERIALAVEGMEIRPQMKDAEAILKKNLENPQWDEIAQRCLSCANCTMVCPTCFCTSTEDVDDLSGDHTERWLRWDSCFNGEFSYIHGGVIRDSTKARYRQWMTHKLAHWHDQFGSSGCVGCGRCISWCPVGIDITEELQKMSSTPSNG